MGVCGSYWLHAGWCNCLGVAMTYLLTVGMADEDMDFLFPHGSTVCVQETVKIIEAKLKERNA